MNCLFWNVGRKLEINQYLSDVVTEYKIDLLILAEYTDDKNELLSMLSKTGNVLYHVPQIACTRIHIFSVYTPAKIKHIQDTNHYTINRIPHPSLGLLTFAFVHFPSKLHSEEMDYLIESRFLKDNIEQAERRLDSKLTVVAGDFNMNPFDKGMMASTALHSFPTKDEVKREKRTINGRSYTMFYNPMWNFFGDKDTPFGTYHYTSTHHQTLYWNVFDQVLVRPSLAENISSSDIKILTRINQKSLINKNGKPNISDHLPLFFAIK
ncbi:hypothetical protein COJ90_21320 [Priestia megaterium]|uniref:endonuclease/exonuclease/phosphatase family protein n=1 Tax=Priestia megaterium TaxID=1404 RepID=UPI000BF46AB6|nr:endonuclease/exonuclease/phosphatase family protein [Priestia megaterium]PFP09256.1 hypothetical protein COJ90_21320 [Priestia megaterium]